MINPDVLEALGLLLKSEGYQTEIASSPITVDFPATQFDLAAFLTGETYHTVQRAFPGGFGRWGVARTSFREGGLPHQLLVITDLTRPLRLRGMPSAAAPCPRPRSRTQQLAHAQQIHCRQSRNDSQARAPPERLARGHVAALSVIAGRAESLARFLGAYAKLARLPRPTLVTVNVAEWLRRGARLETRVPVIGEPGPDLTLQADSDQLEQVLINLLRNAADAMDSIPASAKAVRDPQPPETLTPAPIAT
jgi:two-component system nitrogen regulation sensor histidine kinase NtrY